MIVNYVELLGWLGFILLSIGYYTNSKKNIICFYFWAMGNIVFIFYAFLITSIPMLCMSLFTLIMNVYGYFNWIKDN